MSRLGGRPLFNDLLSDAVIGEEQDVRKAYEDVFNHIKAVMDTFSQTSDIARIATFGIVDMKKNEQKLFFSIDNVSEFRYYYSINRKQLEEEGDFPVPFFIILYCKPDLVSITPGFSALFFFR